MKRTEEFALMSVERRGVTLDVSLFFLSDMDSFARGCCQYGKYVDRSFNIFPSFARGGPSLKMRD